MCENQERKQDELRDSGLSQRVQPLVDESAVGREIVQEGSGGMAARASRNGPTEIPNWRNCCFPKRLGEDHCRVRQLELAGWLIGEQPCSHARPFCFSRELLYNGIARFGLARLS